MKRLLIILFFMLFLVTSTLGDVYTSHQLPKTDGTLNVGSVDLFWHYFYGTAFTDGTAYWESNQLYGFDEIVGTTIIGDLFTDGIATWTGGELYDFTSISGDTLTDTILSINAGSITSAVDGTFSGTLTGTTLTDGTFIVSGGEISAGEIIATFGDIDIGGNTLTCWDILTGQIIAHSTSDPQLLLRHTTGVDEAGFYVDSDGDLTITPTRDIIFQPATDSTTFFQVLDAAGDIVGNFDTTNIRFGIGDASPDYPLEILNATGPQLTLTHTDTTYHATFDVASDGLLTIITLDTAAAEADICLMPDGNVGIGTTGPGEKLEINGNLKFTGAGTISSASGDIILDTADDVNISLPNSNGNGIFHVTNSNGDNVLRVQSDGNVGIGTATPLFQVHNVQSGQTGEASAILATDAHFASTIATQGAGHAYFLARDVTNDIEFISGVAAAGGTFAGAMTAHDFWLRTDNVNRITIKATTGNVGIGVTDPDAKLEVFDAGIQLKLSNDAANFTTFQTDASGDLQIVPSLQYIVIGSGQDTDYGWYFYGNTSQGLVEWNEDLAYFQISGNDATNYTKIAADGTITLHGTATVNRHLWVAATSFRPSGAVEATQGINTHLIFRNNFDDEAYYSTHVPYRRAAGSDIIVELVWYYTGGNDNTTCEWNLSYNSIAHIGGDPTGVGTALAEQAVAIATDDTTGHVSFTIPTASLTAHDTLVFKIWRDGSDALTASALLLGAHIHIVMDKLGE